MMKDVGVEFATCPKKDGEEQSQYMDKVSKGSLFHTLLGNEKNEEAEAFFDLLWAIYAAFLLQNEAGGLNYWDELFQKNLEALQQYQDLYQYCLMVSALLRQQVDKENLPDKAITSRIQNNRLLLFNQLKLPDNFEKNLEDTLESKNKDVSQWESKLVKGSYVVVAGVLICGFLTLMSSYFVIPAIVGVVFVLACHWKISKIAKEQAQLVENAQAFTPRLLPAFNAALQTLNALVIPESSQDNGQNEDQSQSNACVIL